MSTPNPIRYIEIPAPDIEKAGRFYSHVFHWKITPSDLTENAYWMFSSGDGELTGGLDSLASVQPRGITPYLKVDDITKTLEEIQRFDGTVVREKFDIGGGYGFSALFEDPNGNVLGLFSDK